MSPTIHGHDGKHALRAWTRSEQGIDSSDSYMALCSHLPCFRFPEASRTGEDKMETVVGRFLYMSYFGMMPYLDRA